MVCWETLYAWSPVQWFVFNYPQLRRRRSSWWTSSNGGYHQLAQVRWISLSTEKWGSEGRLPNYWFLVHIVQLIVEKCLINHHTADTEVITIYWNRLELYSFPVELWWHDFIMPWGQSSPDFTPLMPCGQSSPDFAPYLVGPCPGAQDKAFRVHH